MEIIFPWQSPRKNKKHGIEKSEESFWTFHCSGFWNKICDFPGPFHKAFQRTARSITQGPVKGWVEPGRNTAVAIWSCCKNGKHTPIYDRVLPQSCKALHHQTITDIILRSAARGGWNQSSQEAFVVLLSKMAGIELRGERKERKFQFMSQSKSPWSQEGTQRFPGLLRPVYKGSCGYLENSGGCGSI